MAKNKRKQSKSKVEKTDKAIELAKQIPTSIISVSRESEINVASLTANELEVLYATVPEVTRSIDLRGAASIYRGYEISPRNDSTEAKEFANRCSYLINKSGGVNFVEQWQKNADLYGNGYVEIMTDGSVVEELVHVSAHNFGYELETFTDPESGEERTRIKVDKDTGKPVGYATYTFNESAGIFENDKKIPLEAIAHLKYKLIGDNLYGVSLIQPMTSSITNKLQIENSIVSAARLVAAPKMVVTGNFDSEEQAREKAREAASLDVNDVVLLDNGDDFKFVNPGQIQLPQLREIFITNITTASGIPRPVLTSESAEINKATLQELMRELRENMRSNMGKIVQVMEQQIFMRIGEIYGINDYHKNIPIFSFPEDPDTEEEIIVREEKKAATLTSLSNSIAILNGMMTDSNGEANPLSNELEEAMKATITTYMETIETFTVNNDQEKRKIEEEMPEDIEAPKSSELQLDGHMSEQSPISFEEPVTEAVEEVETVSFMTLEDDIDTIKQPNQLMQRHNEMHILYDVVYGGGEVYDYNTGVLITLPMVVKKHQQYLNLMKQLGVIHDLIEEGSDLDQIA